MSQRVSPLRRQVVAECIRLFDRAEAVTKDPDVLQRVRQMRLGIDYVEVMQPIIRGQTAGHEKETLAKLDRLYARCKEYGLTFIREGEWLDSFYPRTRAGIARP